MTETKFDLNISKDMNLLELSTKHVDGNLYFVKTEKNWVADNDSIYVHSLIGFFSELNFKFFQFWISTSIFFIQIIILT